MVSQGTLLAGIDALCFPYLGLTSGSTTQKLVCNKTQELQENGESKESLVAARIVLGAGEQYGGVDSYLVVGGVWRNVGSCLLGSAAPQMGPGCPGVLRVLQPVLQAGGAAFTGTVAGKPAVLSRAEGGEVRRPIQAKPAAAVGLEVLGDFCLSWTGSLIP